MAANIKKKKKNTQQLSQDIVFKLTLSDLYTINKQSSKQTNATCGLCVISSVSNYILLEMALFSEHLQTDGFKSFWYSNFVYLMIEFTTGLSWFVQTIKQHKLNSLRF